MEIMMLVEITVVLILLILVLVPAVVLHLLFPIMLLPQQLLLPTRRVPMMVPRMMRQKIIPLVKAASKAALRTKGQMIWARAVRGRSLRRSQKTEARNFSVSVKAVSIPRQSIWC